MNFIIGDGVTTEDRLTSHPRATATRAHIRWDFIPSKKGNFAVTILSESFCKFKVSNDSCNNFLSATIISNSFIIVSFFLLPMF
jgi:hypothetical protein